MVAEPGSWCTPLRNLLLFQPSQNLPCIGHAIVGKDLDFIESIQSPIFWGAIVVDAIMVIVMTNYFKRKKKKQDLEKAQNNIEQ